MCVLACIVDTHYTYTCMYMNQYLVPIYTDLPITYHVHDLFVVSYAIAGDLEYKEDLLLQFVNIKESTRIQR